MQLFRTRVARFYWMSFVNIIFVIFIQVLVIIVFAVFGLSGYMRMDYAVNVMIGVGMVFLISVIFYGYFYCVIKTYNDNV